MNCARISKNTKIVHSDIHRNLECPRAPFVAQLLLNLLCNVRRKSFAVVGAVQCKPTFTYLLNDAWQKKKQANKILFTVAKFQSKMSE